MWQNLIFKYWEILPEVLEIYLPFLGLGKQVYQSSEMVNL